MLAEAGQLAVVMGLVTLMIASAFFTVMDQKP